MSGSRPAGPRTTRLAAGSAPRAPGVPLGAVPDGRRVHHSRSGRPASRTVAVRLGPDRRERTVTTRALDAREAGYHGRPGGAAAGRAPATATCSTAVGSWPTRRRAPSPTGPRTLGGGRPGAHAGATSASRPPLWQHGHQRAAHRNLHRGGHVRRGGRARARRTRRAGREAVELMPVAQFPGRRNWGYDGVFPFAVQNSYGGPAGLQRFVEPATARPRGDPRRRLQPSRPRGKRPHSYGPTSRTATGRPGGRRQLRRRRLRRGPAYLRRRTPSPWFTTTTSTASAWTRCTRSSTTRPDPFLAELSDAVDELEARPADAALPSSPRARTTTRGWSGRGLRRPRHRRPVERRLPPRPARRAHRRTGRVLRGLRHARRSGHAP